MTQTPDTMDAPPGVVAVIDDDASVMHSLLRWLDMLGIAGVGHPDADALLLSLAHGPRGWTVPTRADGAAGRLCAAIVDLNLPGMNGFELAEHLLQGDPSLRVVVITAARWTEEALYREPPPGVSCLSKPFRLEEIEALVLGARA